MELRWLAAALRNLNEEFDYIARDDPRAAARVVAKIEAAVALLAEHPALGRAGRVPGTRELVIAETPYIIPYRVRGQRVEILRVFHARRRWPSGL
ncbi:MAG: type II toxin-antitoxin system RelE/ParE family toxin [Nevskia sp.]|nr:type II toxin-antitoxin system RelE/ParE family toxin [Nevskia sp.]